MHKIEVPAELLTVDELILPTSYPAKGPNEPAFALYVVYPNAGLVEVLPQKWFTASQYQVGKQWITRAARDLGVASDFWRMFWNRHLPAGGRWMPPGPLAGKERLDGSTQSERKQWRILYGGGELCINSRGRAYRRLTAAT